MISFAHLSERWRWRYNNPVFGPTASNHVGCKKMKSFTIGEPANSGFNITQLGHISLPTRTSIGRQTLGSSSVPFGDFQENLDETCLLESAFRRKPQDQDVQWYRHRHMMLFGGNGGKAVVALGKAATNCSRSSLNSEYLIVRA